MRRIIAILWWLALAPVDSFAEVAGLPANASADYRIVIDREAMTTSSGEARPPAYMAAWMVYGTIRGAVYQERQRRNPDIRTDNDYEVEVRARSGLANFWREQEKGKAPPDAYLDQLVKIHDAGFIEEYVIATYATPGWTIPAGDMAKLDLDGFWKWGSDHISEREAQTYAHIRIGDESGESSTPGDDLPDPQQFMPGEAPCSKSMGALGDAVARWDAQAAKLGGTPVAAEDLRDFNLTLTKIVRMEPYRTTGVTWVSSRPATLAFLAGFCAVDLQNYVPAEGYLTKAVQLVPLVVGPRIELAQALIALKKLDAADAVVDGVIATSEDDCDLGRAWRKRGYIRFDQGRLEEARSAYRKSLKFDPDSRIAISELRLLEAQIVQHGGTPDPYEAPPPGEQIVVQCRGE